MFEHIKAVEEKFAANLDPRPHMVAALRAIATRLDEIGKTADGALAEQVKAIDDRLKSLANAVVGIGSQYTAMTDLLKQVMARQDEIDAQLKASSAPAIPPVPPQQ